MQGVLANSAASLHPTAVGLVLDFCDIPTLARILCVNKTLAAHIHQAIEDNGHTLLSRAVCAAAVGGKQHQQALEWLLTITKHPRHVLNSSADTIMNIPLVRLEVAKTLVAAGLHFSWPDIAAAAARHIAGVEVWVDAGAVVGDIPELVRFMCHFRVLSLEESLMGLFGERSDLMYTGLQQLHPSDLSAVLQLAANASRCSVDAGHILSAIDNADDSSAGKHLSEQQRQLLKQQITPPLLKQLTETACFRNNTDDITCIAESSAADDVPTQVILDQLQQAVHKRQAYTAGALLAFKQAGSMGAGQLVELLQLALHNRDNLTAMYLLQGGMYDRGVMLSACSLLTAETVCGLVALALQHLPPDSTSHHRLLQLPAAQGLDATAVAQLLQLAIHKIPPKDKPDETLDVQHPIKILLQLPAAAGIDADTLASLIQVTIQQGGYCRARLLLRQDAAQEIQAQHLVKLLGILFQLRLESASGSAKWEIVKAIMDLPAALELSTEDITHLLKGQAGKRGVLPLLLGLPGAQRLDTAVMSQLLLHHVTMPAIMQQLLALPAAQQLQAGIVQTLLDATIFAAQSLPDFHHAFDYINTVEMLCKLPAAAELDAEKLAILVQMSLQAGLYINATILLERLAAGCSGVPSAEAVMDVLTIVVLEQHRDYNPRGNMPSVEELRQQLPGANNITSSQLAHLMSKALQLRHDEHVMGLLCFPGARKMEPVQIEQLLQQAIQAGHVQHPPLRIVADLCALPRYADILPRAVQRLLHLAIQQQGTFRDHLAETSSRHYQDWEPQTQEKSWQADWDDIVVHLCWLPAAAGYRRSSIRSFLQLHLQPAPVAELLQTAIQLNNPTAVVELCHWLPGADGIDATMAAELLLAAAVHKLCSSRWLLLQPLAKKAVEVLLRLPGMQQIGLDSTKSILRLAVQHTHRNENDSEKCQCCCPLFLGAIGLRPRRALSSADIQELVALASQHGNLAAVQVLRG